MARPIVRAAPLAVTLALALAGAGCSLAVDTEVTARGIGMLCEASSDCHAGACDAGLCTAPCASNDDCPSPSACFEGTCALPLRVAALWEGVVSSGEGWNTSHHEGMEYAAARLPYLSWTYREGVVADADGSIEAAIHDVIADGAQVVVANSFNQQTAVLVEADDHPDVSFLVGGGSISNGRNVAPFYVRYEQAAYVAGQVAATRAARRLGIIAALVTPEQVREVNAFTLGARSVKPELVVEVGWIGFWLDYLSAPSFEHKGEQLYREEALAARMIESGCEVIFHQSDNQRTVRYVEHAAAAGGTPRTFSIATNNRNGCRTPSQGGAPGEPLATCLGSAYYNWGPLYVRSFEQMHRGTWAEGQFLLEPMTADESSPVGFELNARAGVDDVAARYFVTATAEKGPDQVFAGPYATTGQRDKDGDGVADAAQEVAAGETLSEDEFHRVCWFVRGVVMKADPLDPLSADVDGLVPGAGVPPPPDLVGPPGAPPGVGLTCQENI